MDVPMPCCLPQANFPRPTDRRPSGRPNPANAPGGPLGGPRRRQTYYSPALHRASVLIQDPALITIREAGLLILLCLALWRGVPAARHAYELLAVADAGALCRGRSLLGCAGGVAGAGLLRLLWFWLAGVVPWGFVIALGVFVAEEVMVGMKRRR
ncbi:hypothetical protein NKR23_g9728 [Pleurostoma richardsiae]|uniref:Uncharacterized protein n=1 Tax=Pleurostoma richardsiae TaxID=41990 RepID=A0AA38R6I2_9PEZI|nr:hypothetical protein NKR23_g9728 [Pleurostoma richardsiae]